MLQADAPADYVIGTGVQNSVRECYELAFARVGLEPEEFVKTDKSLQRPAEVDTLLADASKAEKELGWRAETSFECLVGMMVDADLEAQQKLHGVGLGDPGTRWSGEGSISGLGLGGLISFSPSCRELTKWVLLPEHQHYADVGKWPDNLLVIGS